MKRTAGCFLIVSFMTCFLGGVQYPFINYKTADGLPQNYITAISQDDHGYIWIGTQSGVGIFNGKEFIRTLSTSDGLPGSFINDIKPGGGGRMWVATNEGVAVLHQREMKQVFLRGRSIRRLIVDPGKNQVLGLGSGRLYRMNPRGDSQQISFPGKNQTFPPITQATIDLEGRIFVAAGNRVLRNSLDSPSRWREIHKGGKIEMLCSRRHRVLLVMDGEIRSLDTVSPQIRIPLPPDCGAVSDLDMDIDHSIWLGTRTGLFSRASPGETWQHFHAGNGMHFSIVTRVFVDREHTVFAGTRFGLSQLGSAIFRMYRREDGLPSEFICCMMEDGPERILVGGYEGIAEIDDGRIHAFPVNRYLKDYQVRSILKIDSSNYLLGTRYNGIFLWDRKERLHPLYREAQVMSGLKDSRGTFWFGTDTGLLRSDGHRFTRVNRGLKHRRAWALAEWTPGVMLVGTGQGLQIFSDGKFIRSDLENLLGTVNVTDIRISPAGEILVSTVVNGLYIYREGKLINLSTRNGLLHNDVWYSLGDNEGNIWLNTSVSLDRYHNGFFSHFSKKTGLFGDEGFIHAALKTASGNLFFGVSPGIVELRAKIRDFPSEPPNISSMDVRVNDLSRPLDDLTALKSHEHTLEFNFFAVSTRLDHPVYYRWRLLPLSREWSPPALHSSTRFSHLPPGKYTFEVSTGNVTGAEAAAESSHHIHFEIRKPVWVRWWFLAICLLLLAALFRLGIFLRLRMLESQKRRLEKRIHEHTSELARKNHELVVLSITDPLTGLKNRRYLDDKINEEVHLVERSLYQAGSENSPGDGNRILTFFIIDIDHFKSVNDIHGHHAGDRVLVGVAQTLKQELRTSDTLIRWGGEEFLVVTRNKRSDDSYQLAERMRTAIASRDFWISPGHSEKKTVSIGFARFPFIPKDARTITWQQVISLADSALYLAKLNGRNLSVGIEPGDGFTDIPFSEVITRMDEQAAQGRIRLFSSRHELFFRSTV